MVLFAVINEKHLSIKQVPEPCTYDHLTCMYMYTQAAFNLLVLWNESDAILLVMSFSLILLGVEYVKVILKDGRMVGAILIGDTDLEVRLNS